MIKCKHCESEFDIEHAIEASLFSWPKSKMIWYVCKHCEQGNNILFDKGSAHIVELQGSPGHEYNIISSKNEPTIEIRIDPEYLHIWYMGKHYEIKERK